MCFNHFRYCLDLIEEPVDDIITECHLIEAIGILATCKVTILPVQGVVIIVAIVIIVIVAIVIIIIVPIVIVILL